tara:strand:+ start:916 stop:1392 length:477 start_codon:yes stop_codon:yes gene_type:complete
MFDPQMELLMTVLIAVVHEPTLEGPNPLDGSRATWAEAKAAREACGEIEEDVGMIIDLEDEDELKAVIAEWMSGKRHLLVHDRDVLKRALKAFRKRLKVTLLDAESSLGGGPMSGGRKSSIMGIRPPERYPRSVWDELARQGRLIDGRQGLFELPPGG